jgi:hypothetical protein
MPGGLEPLHPPLPLAGGWGRVLGPVVQVPGLPMPHARQDLALGRAVALELIRAEHPWDILTALEELPKALLGGLRIPSPLHQDGKHHTVLIHRPPQRVALFMNRDEHLIQVPLIPRLRTSAAPLMGLLLAALAAPLADGFV